MTITFTMKDLHLIKCTHPDAIDSGNPGCTATECYLFEHGSPSGSDTISCYEQCMELDIEKIRRGGKNGR